MGNSSTNGECCSGHRDRYTAPPEECEVVASKPVLADRDEHDKAVLADLRDVCQGQTASVCVVESAPSDVRQIELRRTTTARSLGLGLFVTPQHLVIRSITSGMVQSWNAAHPGEEVRKGSAILGVNGSCCEPQRLFNRLRTDVVVNLQLTHVPSMTLNIAAGTKLGIELCAQGVEVQQIVEGGAIYAYNQLCYPGYHLAPGDVIVGVNEESSDRRRMLQLMDEEACMTLSIVRAPAPVAFL